MTTST